MHPLPTSRRLGPLCLAVAALAAAASPLDEPIKPVPLTLHQDPAKAALGKRLFHDTRLSSNNAVSCASCHNVAQGGGDLRRRSPGLRGQPGAVNTPSVLNAALNFRQFWDGRADTLEAQIDMVIRNPAEMGSSWQQIMGKLSGDAGYRSGFAAAYRDGLTAANVRNAIASYERTLITPNARFDQYLRGNRNAISEAEKAGYAKFKQYGCVSCHQGVNVGGNMFQKFGVMGDYFASRGGVNDADLGRYMVTHNTDDLHVFKVPGLRNVARTGPYFHDGSAATLEQAIDVMFKFQLGRTGSKEDKAAIILFLNTLNSVPAEQP